MTTTTKMTIHRIHATDNVSGARRDYLESNLDFCLDLFREDVIWKMEARKLNLKLFGNVARYCALYFTKPERLYGDNVPLYFEVLKYSNPNMIFA